MDIENLKIELTDFGNASMVDDRSGEVIRILRGIIKQIDNYGVANLDGTYLRDINGNTVGEISINFTETTNYKD
jgi:hypothetical protein